MSLFLFACGFSQIPAEEVPTKKETRDFVKEGAVLLKAAEDLKSEWGNARSKLAEKFEQHLEDTDAVMSGLKLSLDHGDEELRLRIQERIADMSRMRDDLAQILDEIKAAGAIKIINIQGDVRDVVEDLQD